MNVIVTPKDLMYLVEDQYRSNPHVHKIISIAVEEELSLLCASVMLVRELSKRISELELEVLNAKVQHV